MARNKKNRSILSVVRQKVFGIFAFSKRKGDATFDQTVVMDLVHVMKTGKLKSGSRCEWFYKGERILGSSTLNPLISDKLKEAATAVPLHKELLRIVDKRDRCTGQFQGANAFYSIQEFKNRTQTNVVDLSQTSCHGKGHSDGASNIPTGHLRAAAKENQPVAPGTRGLVLFLADKMRKTPSAKKDSWMCFDDYLVAYYPEEAFDSAPFQAQSGYKGSSSDHFYTNSGLHRIATRHLRCMCPSCIAAPGLYSESCNLTDWCGKVKHYNLEPADTTSREDHVRPTTNVQTLEEFAATLGPHGSPCERVVACVVHEDDANELDEPFYLARVVSKARKLDTDCLVGGNEYKKGDLVVRIRWYLHIGDTRGDRVYRLQPGCKKGVVYSVKSIVQGLSGIKFKSYDRGKYILGRESTQRLTSFVQ